MKEIKNNSYKGTRILIGNSKRELVDSMIDILKEQSFVEIQVPIIQHSEIFSGKVGEENNNMMYNFTDRGNRNLCLTPEITAVIQPLAQKYFKGNKDVKLFYVAECFRGEKPQLGRYRQFTQLGVEILNPTNDYSYYCLDLAMKLINNTIEYTPITNLVRGLDYYEGSTFELQDNNSKLSVCGGGAYENGIGFAIGIDRLIKLIENEKENKKVGEAN